MNRSFLSSYCRVTFILNDYFYPIAAELSTLIGQKASITAALLGLLNQMSQSLLYQMKCY